MIKGSAQQKDGTRANVYAHNTGAPEYMKYILTDIRGEINSNTADSRGLAQTIDINE